MAMRSIRDAAVAGKRVLVRVDFNVPLDDGCVADDTRIRAALPTISLLRERGARVILMSHLGRPKGHPDASLRLAPVAERLEELIEAPVQYVDDVAGETAAATAEALAPGSVLLLENLRFEPGEEENDESFARRLASLADLYCNDAFGAAHRAHASTVGVAHILPAYAGLLLEREVETLGRLLEEPDRSFVAILGGAKVSDKLGVLARLLRKVDTLVIGGGMANTFLLASGFEVGDSLAEPDLVGKAREVLADADHRRARVLLPSDARVAPSLDGQPETKSVSNIAAGESIFDIGPATAETFAGVIAGAATIFWNGPMGVFERPAFAEGTRHVAAAVAAAEGVSIVGGGDSIAAIQQLGLADRIGHLSTGGGASLEFLEGRTLPGVAAIPSV
ncbi:MAG TPA: phosphoglycerate kinase [Thermomicrobiales bacterium]|nr:phosphoglycerate kinase [Thermomicrobiales bacterium]